MISGARSAASSATAGSSLTPVSAAAVSVVPIAHGIFPNSAVVALAVAALAVVASAVAGRSEEVAFAPGVGFREMVSV